MRRAALAMLGVMLALGAAYADGDAPTKPSYHVTIDRVDHEPASITGTRLQIEFSALTLQGQLIDLTDPKVIKTYVGNTEIKQPFALGTFAGTKDKVAIVIVVQTTGDYTEVLPAIAETLDTSLLAALDETTTQVAILPYGDSIGGGKLTSMKAARTRAIALTNDGSAGDPRMLETIERALSLLKRAKTEPEGRPLRKIVLLIGDGRDINSERERITKLGNRAAKEGVRIHSFGFSATGTRRPLLALGELSKRSFGTFRWLQRDKQDSWTPAFEQLRDEILKQYVLTYFLSADDDPSGKKLKVVTVGRVEATSNEMKVPEATCNGEVCTGYCAGSVCATPKAESGRGILGWILMIGGIAIGAVLLLAVISFVLSKRSPSIPLPPGMELPPGAVKPKKEKKVKAPKGQPQPAAGVQPAAAGAPIAPGPHLIILNGPRAGERLALRNGFVIGKQLGSDLQIEDGFTSSLHAQIAMDHFGNCRIYDQGSTNGTFVNGVRVTEYVLENGVSMRIGSTELRFLAQ
jgi:FHA domain